MTTTDTIEFQVQFLCEKRSKPYFWYGAVSTQQKIAHETKTTNSADNSAGWLASEACLS